MLNEREECIIISEVEAKSRVKAINGNGRKMMELCNGQDKFSWLIESNYPYTRFNCCCVWCWHWKKIVELRESTFWLNVIANMESWEYDESGGGRNFLIFLILFFRNVNSPRLISFFGTQKSTFSTPSKTGWERIPKPTSLPCWRSNKSLNIWWLWLSLALCWREGGKGKVIKNLWSELFDSCKRLRFWSFFRDSVCVIGSCCSRPLSSHQPSPLPLSPWIVSRKF